MENPIYGKAISETLHFLKGIRQEDIEKIPNKYMNFLKDNADSDYICDFDYTQPIDELEIMDETVGIISSICYNYWCVTDEEKHTYISHLEENEKKYQEEKSSYKNLFNQNKKNSENKEIKENECLPVVTTEQGVMKSFFKKILGFIIH